MRTRRLALDRWHRAGRLRGLGSGGLGVPPADAPVLRVGDRWVYRVARRLPRAAHVGRDARGRRRRARSASPSASPNRPDARGPRTETWTTPGLLAVGPVFDDETRRFTPPIAICRLPDVARASAGPDGWTISTRRRSKAGQINRTSASAAGPRRDARRNVRRAAAARADAPRRRGILARADGGELPRPLRAGGGAMVRAEKNAHFVQRGRGGLGAVTIAARAGRAHVVHARRRPSADWREGVCCAARSDAASAAAQPFAHRGRTFERIVRRAEVAGLVQLAVTAAIAKRRQFALDERGARGVSVLR